MKIIDVVIPFKHIKLLEDNESLLTLQIENNDMDNDMEHVISPISSTQSDDNNQIIGSKR